MVGEWRWKANGSARIYVASRLTDVQKPRGHLVGGALVREANVEQAALRYILAKIEYI